MQDHIAVCYPEEGCGLVAGTGNTAVEILPITNQSHSQTHFTMDPLEQLEAFYKIEKKGMSLLAIYHSHPYGPRFPSAHDVEAFSYPGVIYLIWSLDAGDWQVSGYEINQNNLIEIQLLFVD